MSVYVAIDPGLHGAVAALDEKGSIIGIWDTPIAKVKKGKGHKHVYLESQMATILGNLMPLPNTTQDEYYNQKIRMLGIEAVHAMPGQGVTSMFSMGTGFGIWLGIIAALRIPHERIEPAKWKREMGIAAKSDKGASVVRALQIFPRADIPASKDGRADALLLAEWLRRKLTGEAISTPKIKGKRTPKP